ncbi:ATP-binding protein [Polymorphospora lycopeni]|uniref:ATP-binding protein n=1 Tax=Polymorphospora lycopeni TaxID=3140240 RepID=A0ABV5D0T5_9ACTN
MTFAAVSAHIESGALVITLCGPLTVPAVAATRRALAWCVAHRPPAVLVDCARVATGRRTTATVLTAAMARTASQCGTRLALCTPTRRVGGLLRRARHAPFRIYGGLGAALRELRPHHVPAGTRRAHLRLEPQPDAPAAARRLLRAKCAEWGLDQVVDPGQMIVSELVANAVEHAGTPIDLTLSHAGRKLRIAVADRSPAHPAFPGPEPAPRDPAAGLSIRGRGLGLVSLDADGCGVVTGPDGKIVWASVTTPARVRVAGLRRWHPASLSGQPRRVPRYRTA